MIFSSSFSLRVVASFFSLLSFVSFLGLYLYSLCIDPVSSDLPTLLVNLIPPLSHTCASFVRLSLSLPRRNWKMNIQNEQMRASTDANTT